MNRLLHMSHESNALIMIVDAQSEFEATKMKLNELLLVRYIITCIVYIFKCIIF